MIKESDVQNPQQQSRRHFLSHSAKITATGALLTAGMASASPFKPGAMNEKCVDASQINVISAPHYQLRNVRL